MEFVFVSKRREFYEAVERDVGMGFLTGEYVWESIQNEGIFEVLAYRCCATDTYVRLIRTGRGDRYFDVRGHIADDLADQISRFGIPFDRRNITRIK